MDNRYPMDCGKWTLTCYTYQGRTGGTGAVSGRGSLPHLRSRYWKSLVVLCPTLKIWKKWSRVKFTIVV